MDQYGSIRFNEDQLYRTGQAILKEYLSKIGVHVPTMGMFCNLGAWIWDKQDRAGNNKVF